MEPKLVQPENALFPIEVIPFGIVIDVILLQCENTYALNVLNWLFPAKTTVDKLVQL